ncbi:glycoside hydrolase family 16 protein [Rhodoblastus sp.]|uniref:glycoside hydrolase family 16 protein n=1 Tax=Rhodoblastus sp. TaxID=1962975 RepID=UPI003F9D6538
MKPTLSGMSIARRYFLRRNAALALAGATFAFCLPEFAAAISLESSQQKSGASTPPAGFSASDLVFWDSFSGKSLNAASWNTYVTSNAARGYPWAANGQGGSALGSVNNAEYMTPSQVSVNNGLTLDAVLHSIAGYSTINGSIVRQTFPVTSGVVSSYGKFEFTGGYLQISMKQPAGGAGSWPALWLLPGSGAGSSGDDFEIDIQEGGYTSGSANPDNVFAYHLHTPAGVFGGEVDTGIDLTAGFNSFAINWAPGESITWYLNGQQVAQITSAEAPIPNEPMELIMSNGVATSAASAWHTALGPSTPRSMRMQVNSVQLYQQPGGGETVKSATFPRPR